MTNANEAIKQAIPIAKEMVEKNGIRDFSNVGDNENFIENGTPVVAKEMQVTQR